VATWISLAGLAFAPIRNVFAWSFDRLVPTKLSEIRTRYRAPVGAIAVVIGVAYIFFILEIFYPDAVAAVAYTIVAWFLAWIVLGIAGMLYPYRRKEMFEAGPPSTQKRILGIPVISILGFATLVVSIYTEWAVAQPIYKGDLSSTQYIVVAVMAILPIIIYVWAHFYHKSRGIPLKLQFSQVPPE
jgi:amino acid transporter